MPFNRIVLIALVFVLTGCISALQNAEIESLKESNAELQAKANKHYQEAVVSMQQRSHEAGFARICRIIRICPSDMSEAGEIEISKGISGGSSIFFWSIYIPFFAIWALIWMGIILSALYITFDTIKHLTESIARRSSIAFRKLDRIDEKRLKAQSEYDFYIREIPWLRKNYVDLQNDISALNEHLHEVESENISPAATQSEVISKEVEISLENTDKIKPADSRESNGHQIIDNQTKKSLDVFKL